MAARARDSGLGVDAIVVSRSAGRLELLTASGLLFSEVLTTLAGWSQLLAASWEAHNSQISTARDVEGPGTVHILTFQGTYVRVDSMKR